MQPKYQRLHLIYILAPIFEDEVQVSENVSKRMRDLGDEKRFVCVPWENLSAGGKREGDSHLGYFPTKFLDEAEHRRRRKSAYRRPAMLSCPDMFCFHFPPTTF